MSAETTEIKGAEFVKEIFTSPNNWSVCMYADRGVCFSATGMELPKSHGIKTTLVGKWTSYKGKRTFAVQSHYLERPETKQSTVAYLVSLKCGIGKKSALALYEKYGADTIKVCETNPEAVKTIARKCDVTRMKAALSESGQLKEMIEMLGADTLSIRMMRKCIKIFGADTCARIKENPYILGTVSGIGFRKADDIALGIFNHPKISAKRICGAIWHLETVGCYSQGNIYWPREELIRRVAALINIPKEERAAYYESIDKCINLFLKRSRLYEDGSAIYSMAAYAEEMALAANITRLMSGKVKPIKKIDSLIEEFERKEGFSLAENQKLAVLTAINNPLSIITGGAGTGKTTIIKCLLFVLSHKKHKAPIRLMAPTGRAARRMTEVTGVEAETIHRAANLMVGSEDGTGPSAIGMIDEMDASTIIVDEASMIDQTVAKNLLDCIATNTRVVFLGDPDQLPSVGPGNVLREMIMSERIPMVRLNAIFRQSGINPIVENSLKVNRGEVNLNWCKTFKLIELNQAEDILRNAVAFYTKCVKVYGVDNVVLLNPYRVGNLTVDMFNSEIQEKINPHRPGTPTLKMSKDLEFRLDDRVMQTKNQDSGVANGDVGIIREINTIRKDDGTKEIICVIDFSGIVEEYNVSQMESIQLAYCSTVHKAQGAEYQVVILIMFHEHERLLQRNLLYTGITRAKECIAVIGEMSSVEAAIKNNSVIRRNTKLASRIRISKDAKNKRGA